ncbi:aspartate carbamoyltransferase catalytic subunit [Paenisporosarcina antarctica]|uniref:Aspartate carbamoyltransferase n=1 Tax=Paenisporosarcina antarctica TaxID=417367 RepID=A0A4P6ZZ07_9BACL|nr:aspartate carbamoyltransferase catalytic subunit [Paenisporosarcina antarctica]QBP41524.1 aspartate carbamoyltransferase catalytic subunit [Paenisporosarcina antarctica]
MKHLLNMNDLEIKDIDTILNRALEFQQNPSHQFNKQFTVVNLFFEPSTRTKMSFEMAERKLGLHILPFEAGTSSTLKGETMYDTVRTLEAIGVDAVVIRHEQDQFYEELMSGLNLAIINAGDGSGQHPSQCLLDLYTIKQEFGKFEGIHVTIVGDIAHSRVAKSNALALKKLGAHVTFICPPEWQGDFDATSTWEEVLPTADVVMLLRVQHERHGKENDFLKELYHKEYGLTIARYAELKPSTIVMHPAPVNRDVEIASELVESDKSRIFKQIQNGVFVRMAILESVLKERM